jgi:hypothetical protein
MKQETRAEAGSKMVKAEEIDTRGKVIKIYSYNRINTPFEKLKSIPGIKHYCVKM